MAKKITLINIKPKLLSAVDIKTYQKAQERTQHIKEDLIRDAGLNHVRNLFTKNEQSDVKFNADGSITMGSITLDDSQAQAVNGLLGVNFGALIGSAGTGKTTVVKVLVALLEKKIMQEKGGGYEPKFVFCAYTARATNVMAGKLPEKYRKSCMTVHKMLDYAPVVMETKKGDYAKIFKPKKSSENLIEADCIIIDEAGMLNFELWHEVLEASEQGKVKIYLVGDIAQLPPVMGLSPLPIAMKKATCFELNKVHRQALNSPIISAATAVKEGKKPVTAFNLELQSSIAFGALEASDRYGKYDSAVFAYKFVQKIKTAYDNGRFDPWLDIVLSPVLKQFGGTDGLKEYHASCTSLNSVLRGILNPDTKEKPRVIIHGSPHSLSVSTIGLNDKLLLLKNSIYTNVHPHAVGLSVAVANGMLARVTDIKLNLAYEGEGKQPTKEDFIAASKIKIDANDLYNFNDADASVDTSHDNEKLERQCSHIVTIEIIGLKNAAIELRTAGDFSSLLYGYAVTVYKAQGGEYRNVYIALQREGTASLATREMLYTAITRASQNVVVYHDGITFIKCVQNASLKGVTVSEKADNIMAAVATKDPSKVPKMPWDYDKTGNIWHVI